jgi:ABC-type ATPase with predicted acetyltransferase domain
MKLWWCMECQTKVGLNKQGRCEICDSEGVDLLTIEGELSGSVSTASTDSDPAPVRA